LAEAKRKNKSVYSQKKLGELRLVVDNSWETGNAPKGFFVKGWRLLGY
jgi:hypothetical protein